MADALNLTSRTKEICGAVDVLIAVHDSWVADENSSSTLPLSFESALLDCERVADGTIPGPCRQLADAISRLIVEWNTFANGERSQGKPLPRFWGAFRNMLEARKGVEARPPRRPEPVSLLLRQGVGYHQIAAHIYGHNGKGPFMTEAGQPDIDLIIQESDVPGSVVPRDWIHPAEQERVAKQAEFATKRIQTMSRMETVDDVTIDPASVEDLLREGQYTSVIARVKGITVEEVEEIAKSLSIKFTDVPEIRSEKTAFDPPQAESKPTPVIRKKAEPKAEPKPEADDVDESAISARVLELIDEGNGTAEIKTILASEGINISGNKIGSIVRWSRKPQAAE
jgi:hypothetical protein